MKDKTIRICLITVITMVLPWNRPASKWATRLERFQREASAAATDATAKAHGVETRARNMILLRSVRSLLEAVNRSGLQYLTAILLIISTAIPQHAENDYVSRLYCICRTSLITAAACAPPRHDQRS